MAITADRRSSETYYWDVNTLDWVKGTQSSGGGGGGDASAANQVTGNASLASIDGKITAVNTSAVAFSSPQHVINDASTSVIGHVIVDTAPTTAVTGTVAATQSGTWTVQPGNTANTTAWKVDGSAVTQPVSGTVTATQGTATNLKTQAEAYQNGTQVGALNPLQVSLSATGSNVTPVTVSGTVTANAGSNLNTSLLALETTQVTGNSTLSTINTNTAPLVVAAAGGYVRQDSTATIAKESGGNLATLVTNTTGIATAANQILTQATSGSTTAPSKIDVVGGITSADTPQFLPLPLTPLGIAVATQEFNDPSDILLQNLLTEMRLMRQAFQDWSGADPRYDPIANYNFQ